jgi:hypothetical protein
MSQPAESTEAVSTSSCALVPMKEGAVIRLVLLSGRNDELQCVRLLNSTLELLVPRIRHGRGLQSGVSEDHSFSGMG